ncbi:MAG: hypothetical protein A3H52_01985 [Candidatus Zambryskibacteria bacterium RIFCSPLOWO2_02_FULL_39_26]|uniref:Type II secretion system protein J n=1 Tax=Candidatus Zambryskibacteria bacterium RIFCSPLOWO2_12_FULL_39_23 TaxID=1802776 RepID=A0A1G2URA8_9BACT|nr:MAG: hypothetical protein A2W51_01520 [Candidatus Zambryskibacteria bacterium RIFCSPHIGHO2_02_39_10]OHB00244.1 MAG: hypothetical protein A3E59_01630 [Candidatus Zambryskibacteria bacterium RIFCSPHIGHO2_12_FULL_39_47]OHB10063.1 MAG: hypothetical protein A3H52_01985 [Candidatus Zambryskibacteria bacterium RIFCSPLOWO2_02_FULL_39_26]OHB11893.1 MAG: hypothetical protein A3G99_01045 [Candidatus Zambryskibacteria bacterium RIFCSPLOWO2_12_FULL_39_23]
MSKKSNFTDGFTIIEVIISVFILSLIVVSAATFQRDVFSLNFFLQGSLNAQLDARHVVKIMVAELRKASPSALGAYPIALASSTAITFYSDVDSDGVKDRVRYFLSGSTIKRGVLAPSGSPLAYVDANEELTILISGFVSSSTLPLFQYYGATYTGASPPLSLPVDTSSVRLIKITVIIDTDPVHSPAPIIVTSQVNLRNLKDNL